MTLESEISRWNGFALALRKDDCEKFEELNAPDNTPRKGSRISHSTFLGLYLKIAAKPPKAVSFTFSSDSEDITSTLASV